jgi:hypothetical protein
MTGGKRAAPRSTLAVTLTLLCAIGCLPVPMQSPRVEPGRSEGFTVFARAILDERDSLTASGRITNTGPTQVYPDVGAFASWGFARADGRGPAGRVTGFVSAATGMTGDVYLQAPRVGGFSGGVGAMLVRHSPIAGSPYLAAGWRTPSGKELSIAHAIVRSKFEERSVNRATVTTLAWAYPFAPVDSTGRARRVRFLAALFRDNRHAGRGSTSEGGLRSIATFGVVTEIPRVSRNR